MEWIVEWIVGCANERFLGFLILLINMTGFLLMGFDKSRAGRGGWRVSERTLFMVSLAGGAAGVFLGMRLFRHKTKHLTFVAGIPAILALNILLFVLVLKGFQLL